MEDKGKVEIMVEHGDSSATLESTMAAIEHKELLAYIGLELVLRCEACDVAPTDVYDWIESQGERER